MNILSDKKIKKQLLKSCLLVDYDETLTEEELQWWRDMCEAAYRETLKMVKILTLQAIADEPEYPGDMPDEMWEEIIGTREVATETLRITVRLTKDGITDRFLEAINELGVSNGR